MGQKSTGSIKRRTTSTLLLASATLFASYSLAGDRESAPLYKPSSSSTEAIDISSNGYGASSLAPTAIQIGETAPEFTLPVSGGGHYSSTNGSANKPLAIVFYRGHW